MYRKVAFSLLAAAAAVSASDVTQLKTDTFDEFIASNDLVLAECKSTLPLIPSQQENCLLTAIL